MLKSITKWDSSIWEESWPDITLPPKPPTDWFTAIAQLIGQISGQVFDETVKEVTSIFEDDGSTASDSTAIAMGGAADTIGKILTEKSDQDTRRRTQPSPSNCTSGQVASRQLGAKKAAGEVGGRINEGMRRQAMKANGDQQDYLQERLKKFASYQASFSGSLTGNSAVDLLTGVFDANASSMSLLLNPFHVLTGADYINATMAVESVVGFSVNNGAGSLVKYAKSTEYADATRAGHSIRVMTTLLAAQLPFTKAISARIATLDKQTSANTLLFDEVERTYGAESQAYRDAMKALSHEVPLAIELNKLKAFGNYLRYLQLQQKERLVNIRAIEALESIREFAMEKATKSGVV
ncbi:MULTISPECIES: hypothetical protein [Aeromonas]|uniref:Uncharacterized protein n=1 Tax=Aeromonas caviae TaxID=648 RepID=A0AAJ5ZBE5_AERCA|nr:hypothetical protein [Aeromonas caviae]RWT73696.1 hypothetical protein DN604_16535 [Aeromonas caviae]WFG00226.1 hypothetical protein P5S46_22285 [Aeromonas caviae]WVM47845.1 hypothetical protein V0242_24910 [Aeromonas hydrophila]